jgi:pilus assembly protein CpaC
VGQGRILTTKEDLTAPGRPPALIAVGDPTVIDFAVISPRQIRIVGSRIGVTDLSITTPDNRTYAFEVRVVVDLVALRGQLKAAFPDAMLKLAQNRDNLIVEGQARDSNQVARILETIRFYLRSVQVSQATRVTTMQQPRGPAAPGRPPQPVRPEEGGQPQQQPGQPGQPYGTAAPEQGRPTSTEATIAMPQIINLIRVPGPQQVLLKVRVAELNRTALREIGADLLGIDPDTGFLLGTQISSGLLATGVGAGTGTTTGGAAARILTGPLALTPGPASTVFGIFERAHFEFVLRALRRNALLKILAEPNLIAMNGHEASFLAGGEFPVPVPQNIGAGGVGATVTIQFKEFGVRLGFLPFILDGDQIRLSVDPEVSQIDFTIATTIVPGGTPVPGLNTRRAHTTVELREGQTLAIAGLMQVTLDGQTSRIPGLGDLPILGPFFSNTTGQRVEKELVVLVTPYIVEPMNPGQVSPTPGDEVKEPNDLEFYLLNRIEGRTGQDFRSTTRWDDRWHFVEMLKLQKKHVCGPHGFSD